MGRRAEAPRMLNETPAQLVAHLSHPNGWWRDTAQQLLVLKQDKSVAPALVKMARSDANPLARIHALWTLEGLGSLDAALARALMEDADPQMRIQAIRASETLFKAGERALAADYKARTGDADADVVMQAMMTMNTLKAADAPAAIKAAMERHKAKGVQLVASTILKPAASAGRGGGFFMAAVAPFTGEEQATLDKGREIYTQVCFACHGDDGLGGRVPGSDNAPPLGPPLASSPRVLGPSDYVVNTLLHGLSGPLDGINYPDVMIAMGIQNDEWIAAIGSYVRNSFGNRAPFVTPGDVARVRKATAGRKTPWNTGDLVASLPKPLLTDGWKLTASHNNATAGAALTLQPWSSGAAQAPGMWLQVELPRPAMVTALQLESPAVAVDTTPAVPGAPTRSGAGRGTAAPTVPGFARAYEVEVSADGSTWSKPVAQGQGRGIVTEISFAPVRARFVRIRQTGTADNVPWSIKKLRLYETAGGAATP
jgi:mono/diheme cytochrome c family protein